MKTKILISIIVLLLILSLVSAHGEESLIQAEELIKSKIPCDQLTNEQLEIIGDYYMEQMHPGESHEAMDQIMGGEGSESLRQMHLNIARSFYCGEQGVMSSNMMNMMNNNKIIGGENMMFGNEMGFFSPFGWFGMGFGMIFMIIFWGLIIWLIIWLVRNYSQPQRSESAAELLKKRYVKGEITQKQYEKMKKEIR